MKKSSTKLIALTMCLLVASMILGNVYANKTFWNLNYSLTHAWCKDQDESKMYPMSKQMCDTAKVGVSKNSPFTDQKVFAFKIAFYMSLIISIVLLAMVLSRERR